MKSIQFAIFFIAFGFASKVISAELLNVSQHIWDKLQPQQKVLLSEQFVINVRPANSYGVIIDAQSLNESIQGSTAGSQLGAAIASAAYVDSAFSGAPRNWNYSASGNLTAQLAGAMLGSLANQQAQARFRTRYTIKKNSGDVDYIEETKSDAFRHTIGLCVALGPIRPIDSDSCGITSEIFLNKYSFLLENSARKIISQQSQVDNLMPKSSLVSQSSLHEFSIEKIVCKFGLASPVKVSESICRNGGGIVVN